MHGESGSGKSTAGSDGGTGLRAVADSIVIVAFFAAGILCGLYGLLPFDVTETGIAVYALYALIFVVGFSIGNSPDVIGSFRRLSPGLALLPLCTVIGTLAASALMGRCSRTAVSRRLWQSAPDLPTIRFPVSS